MIDVALVVAFYALLTVLIWRVPRLRLAVAAVVVAVLLVGVLIVQAAVSSRVAGYAALGVTLAVVVLGLAVQWEGPAERWRDRRDAHRGRASDRA